MFWYKIFLVFGVTRQGYAVWFDGGLRAQANIAGSGQLQGRCCLSTTFVCTPAQQRALLHCKILVVARRQVRRRGRSGAAVLQPRQPLWTEYSGAVVRCPGGGTLLMLVYYQVSERIV